MNDDLDVIGLRMLHGLPGRWVFDVISLAHQRPAVAGLVRMWATAPDEADRDGCVEALQECLDDRDRDRASPAIASKAEFDREYGARRALKARLRRLVEERGGVSEVARKAEMPQPSLSRLLNSAAEPRAATMARLAAALGVSVSRLYPGPSRFLA